MLVSDIVRRNASAFASADAVVVPGERTTSWEDLEARTNRLGRAFLDLGLRKGDRVATFAPNCGEYIDFFFACAKTGVIGATTNVRLAPYELTSYLQYVEPTAVLVHGSLKDGAGWIDDLPSVKHVIGIGSGHGYDLDLEALIEAQSPEDPGCAIDETDTYQLCATSGTTGVPKGAIMTHRTAIAAMVNWMSEMPYISRGTTFQNIPLFFNPGGPAGVHPVLMTGGRTVIPPAFDPGTFLRAVPEYGVTHGILVPTMVGMVLAHPGVEQHDLSSLMAITIGGSPLPREVLARACQVFGRVFFPLYGMAESYSCGTILRREDQYTEGTPEQLRHLFSAGKPMVLNDIRVVDEDGADVPADNVAAGEVWLKGDTVSPGYFRMEEETAGAFSGPWFKTGDVATVDDEGFITIVDRIKDIIITGGINVFSRDVEEALYAHPAVAQVAVIGIPHEKWGEAIHAVVTLQAGEGAAPTPDELVAFAAERLADYKKPRSLEIVDSLPLGGTGKILKRELRASYWQDQERCV